LSAKKSEKSKNAIWSGQFSTIVSLSLVLFILGLLALVLINAQKLSNHIKENIGFNIFLSDSATTAQISELQKTLDASEFVKSTRFVDKEEAANDFKQEIGEDFVSFLGFNPLRASIDVSLKADYANADSLVAIERKLISYPIVKEVYYQKSLVNLINENVRKITMILLGLSAILALISIALINNSIRLYFYSKRFLIRTMQLVGATPGFIRKPFIIRGLLNGLLGSFITIVLLAGVIWLLQENIPELIELNDIDTFAVLLLVVVISGVIITIGSTWFALNKYLKKSMDELYR
jgi:cell division transport system permease protein